MQRFKSFQPRMGTAAGLSVLVLGLCFGQSCAAAKEPLPQLLEQKPAVSALAMDALPNRIVVTIKGDPSAHITGLQLVHECGAGRSES